MNASGTTTPPRKPTRAPSAGRALLLAVCLAAAGLTGCGHRESLYAPPTTLAGQAVLTVYDAYVTGDRVYVKTKMRNGADQPMHVDRDGFALRLPDGRVLPRASGITTRHNVYTLAPGEEREVHVDFHAEDDFEGLASATLIVGGVRFGTEAVPHVIGEVALSATYAAPPVTTAEPGPPVTPDGASPPPPAASEPAETPPSGGPSPAEPTAPPAAAPTGADI